MSRPPGRPGAKYEPVDPPPDADRLAQDGALSFELAAEWLSVSETTLKRLVKRGVLSVVTIGGPGGRPVIPRRVLVDYLAALIRREAG